MTTVTIPKTEYKRLKEYSSAYLKIVEEIAKTDLPYLYDYRYINDLTKQALKDFKKEKCIEAESVDEALEKFRKRKK